MKAKSYADLGVVRGRLTKNLMAHKQAEGAVRKWKQVKDIRRWAEIMKRKNHESGTPWQVGGVEEQCGQEDDNRERSMAKKLFNQTKNR